MDKPGYAELLGKNDTRYVCPMCCKYYFDHVKREIAKRFRGVPLYYNWTANVSGDINYIFLKDERELMDIISSLYQERSKS